MRYRALAVDFDGTLATDGHVLGPTVDALHRLRASGRLLVMVTGRELPDLHATFAQVALFDLVIVENGALMFSPADGKQTLLAPAPSESLLAALRARDVLFSVGASIVATREPYHAEVSEAIRALGLDCEVILNKGAVMILPAGVNKGTGLARASAALDVPATAIVAMGDAQNDSPLLRTAGLGVAVANALQGLKDEADLVTAGARGDGVIEIIDRLVKNDLSDVAPKPRG